MLHGTMMEVHWWISSTLKYSKTVYHIRFETGSESTVMGAACKGPVNRGSIIEMDILKQKQQQLWAVLLL